MYMYMYVKYNVHVQCSHMYLLHVIVQHTCTVYMHIYMYVEVSHTKLKSEIG